MTKEWADILVDMVVWALPNRYATPPAVRLLVATALTESDGTTIVQLGAYGRPLTRAARSLWQMEFPTVKLLVEKGWAGRLIDDSQLKNLSDVWMRLTFDQFFACRMARALYLSHPHPLPDDAQEALQQYLAVWRPGKPQPHKFIDMWILTEV